MTILLGFIVIDVMAGGAASAPTALSRNSGASAAFKFEIGIYIPHEIPLGVYQKMLKMYRETSSSPKARYVDCDDAHIHWQTCDPTCAIGAFWPIFRR